MRAPLRALLLLLAALAAVVVPATAAGAHSLDSSTISAHVHADGTVDATLSVAVETLDTALGTSWTADTDLTTYAAQVDAYLADHLALTDATGSALEKTFSGASVESVEGITSYTVDVAFTSTGAATDSSSLTLSYDAVIEAVADHEAVVVLTDAAGEISTAGVLTSGSDSLQLVGEATTTLSTGLVDMVGYGLHHVLEGADHLLFLITLLLTAPLVATAGRWVDDGSVRRTVSGVLGVVTAFTLGHSVTLLAAALGWVHLPTQPVEVLVAASVAVAAVHAVRPLVRRGETLIAAAFGLVHGLAFAGILAGLGLSGTASVVDLLAFNVGVELAQLSVVALVFPSLYLLSRTRWYGAARVLVAALAAAVALGWVVERVGWATSPFTDLETAAISRPWTVVAGTALLALLAFVLHRRTGPAPDVRDDAAAEPTQHTRTAHAQEAATHW